MRKKGASMFDYLIGILMAIGVVVVALIIFNTIVLKGAAPQVKESIVAIGTDKDNDGLMGIKESCPNAPGTKESKGCPLKTEMKDIGNGFYIYKDSVVVNYKDLENPWEYCKIEEGYKLSDDADIDKIEEHCIKETGLA